VRATGSRLRSADKILIQINAIGTHFDLLNESFAVRPWQRVPQAAR